LDNIVDENYIAKHAMFSETVLSSLWASLYDLAVAKRNYDTEDYCWTVVSAFYAAEHAVNTLLIMNAEPDIFDIFIRYRGYYGCFNLWEPPSPLSALKSHKRKIKFLKNGLRSTRIPLKYSDNVAKWYKKLCNKYHCRRLRSLGEKFAILYEARKMQNYEGLIIAHFKRRDIFVREIWEGRPLALAQVVKEVAERAIEVSESIVLEAINMFFDMFEDMINNLLRKNNIMYAGIALAHIEHLNEEYEQFKGYFYTENIANTLTLINERLRNIAEIGRKIKERYREKLKDIVNTFNEYTYSGILKRFYGKEEIYKKLVNLKSKLKRMSETV